MLPDGCLDALDRVEVAILADERSAERGDERGRIAAGSEEGGDQLPRFVDLLLPVEQTGARRGAYRGRSLARAPAVAGRGR